MSSTAVVLFLSACATATIHALIPDHWLPFVLLARAQRWSDRRLAGLVALAGALHVLITLLVALLAIVVGTLSAPGLVLSTGWSLESLAGLLLLVFGTSYGLWAHLRERRAHGSPGQPAVGDHVHAHGHLLERWFRGALSGGALVAVVGISPCALLVPLMLAASATGTGAGLAAGLGFAACTILTMVGVALFAMHGMRRLDLPLFERYGDLASGLLIAVIGLLVMHLGG